MSQHISNIDFFPPHSEVVFIHTPKVIRVICLYGLLMDDGRADYKWFKKNKNKCKGCLSFFLFFLDYPIYLHGLDKVVHQN